MLQYSWEEKTKSKAEYSHFHQNSANTYVSQWEKHGGGWGTITHYSLSCSQLNMSHT